MKAAFFQFLLIRKLVFSVIQALELQLLAVRGLAAHLEL